MTAPARPSLPTVGTAVVCVSRKPGWPTPVAPGTRGRVLEVEAASIYPLTVEFEDGTTTPVRAGDVQAAPEVAHSP